MSDKLSHWKTQTEAAEILKCSEKTISRMAAQNKIQRALRRVPGRKPMPVFNPIDVERIRGETVDVQPFVPPPPQESKSLARVPSQASQASQDGVKLLAQLLGDRVASSQSVPLKQKVFLNLAESSEYMGMPKAWLLRQIKSGKVKAILAGGWRIRRVDLEKF